MTAKLAAPSRVDQVWSPVPRLSNRASLMVSLVIKGRPRLRARGTARVVLPLPGAPVTNTSVSKAPPIGVSIVGVASSVSTARSWWSWSWCAWWGERPRPGAPRARGRAGRGAGGFLVAVGGSRRWRPRAGGGGRRRWRVAVPGPGTLVLGGVTSVAAGSLLAGPAGRRARIGKHRPGARRDRR